ncbi:hypothetical protein C8C83_4012 [Flavobacterium sp. 90]|uniref:hypothetical protein n=1 Tax=unclassified Flavobacterium TaxID=196869 RepID=UPI000F246745|nr:MULTISPECIES: hypothetical protein [unclassified Flavobacterium]RKR04679.1 hypothetical protein C8C82_4343 [Flavobacterium sp. 81]TCK56003.1 hypothetical protein C8C83_4012 [Flavobacterium sp. 90]
MVAKIYALKNLKLFVFFLLLIPITVLSQEIEKIKKSDTIYIYFKKDKDNQHVNEEITSNTKIKYYNYYYIFGYLNEYQILMTFTHHYSISPEEKKEKKSFLRKNKDLIITYDFLTKYNLGEATDLIGHKKKVYLIDEDDIGWFTIKLKEVKVIGTFPQSIE